MSTCRVFRKTKNSHEEFVGLVFEKDDGVLMFELRHRERDGRGGFRDGKYPLLRCTYEKSLPIIADLIREAVAAKGGAQ
jgi:hypothetical protein